MHSTAVALFDLIYDAAANPERWPKFLQAYSTALGGGVTCLAFQYGSDLEHGSDLGLVQLVSHGFDDTARANYFDHYSAVDPLSPKISMLPEGVVDFGEPLVPKTELERSEIFADWYRPSGLSGDSLGGIVYRRDGPPSVVGAYQEAGRPNYGNEQLELSRILMPHLRRSLEIHHRLGDAARTTRRLLEAFDTFAFGVLLLDARGSLLAANQGARMLAAHGDGLLLGQGKVRCSRTDDTKALHAAVADALRTARGEGFGSGGAVSARRKAPRGPLQLIVTPLRTAHDETADPPAVAIFVHESKPRTRVPESRLQALYGLTPRQAAVAAELSEGKTLADAAEALGMSVNTAKVRLQEIFDKTETHRQPELMHLLARLGSIRDD